nr:probable methyltransferase PMT10 [Ipomoea trifida]
MKALFTSFSSSDHFSLAKSPAFVKITALSLLSLSVFFLVRHFSEPATNFSASFSNLTPAVAVSVSAVSAATINTSTDVTNASQPSASPPPLQSASPLPVPIVSPPPRQRDFLERTGIVDENGAMSFDFIVGDYDETLLETVVNASLGGAESDEIRGSWKGKFGKFRACDESMSGYIPCLDNVEAISKLNSSEKGENYERHCPEKGKGLDCVVPWPKGYRIRVPWPKSRDEVWVSNVPHTSLVDDKGGQNLISRKKNKFVFPQGGTQFPHGVEQYLDQISKMVPEIAFGQNTRVALDIGCGVGSFGAYLTKRNVLALSIAPKDANNNQIQFALERGVSAMVAGFATRRLLYPSQAFDLIHCSGCGVKWTRDEGILLLEVNRMLRAGGYFVLAEQYVDKQRKLEEQWKEMEDLAGRLCWELVKKKSNIAIWRKPLNNSCYFNRDATAEPLLCGTDDDPDDVWYVNLKPCISLLPENGYGANITAWPARLNSPPDRLFSIKMDAMLSRKEIYKADTKYMNDIIRGYSGAFHWKKLNLRNVMDMKAGNGGFAAALVDFEFDCWVMNVVPVSGSNTLPVIYDRGLIGVMHDWCEPFDTYPRTYDLLNAIGLFSVEKTRCNISNIVLEMDRILRPGGRVYIRDLTPVIDELEEIIHAVGWVVSRFDDSEGPHSNWKLLTCEKRM